MIDYLHGVELTPLRKLLFMGALAGGKEVEDTATGNPLTFLTDLARPLKSCLASWQPHQSGSGDPSPQNVRPVLGMDGVNVWHTGKNLFDINCEQKNPDNVDPSDSNKRIFTPYTFCVGLSANNYFYPTQVSNFDRTSGVVSITGGGAYGAGFSIPLKAGKYRFSGTGSNRRINVAFYASDGSLISFQSHVVNDNDPNRTGVFTVPDGCDMTVAVLACSADGVTATYSTLQIEVGETATAYAPYSGTSYSVAFPVLGKNLLNVADRESGYIASNGKIAADSSNVAFGYILLKANESYVISTKETVMNIGVCLYEMDKATVISRYNNTTKSSVIISSASADRYIRVWMNYDGVTDLSTKTDAEIIQLFAPQVEQGSSPTPYEPYTRTVYGGTLDLTTGVLTAEFIGKSARWGDIKTGSAHPVTGYYQGRIYFDNDVVRCVSALDYGVNTFCNCAKIRWELADMTPQHYYIYGSPDNMANIYGDFDDDQEIVIVVKLTEPIVLATLSPTQITALIGNNTMWADADDLSVTYLKKG